MAAAARSVDPLTGLEQEDQSGPEMPQAVANGLTAPTKGHETIGDPTCFPPPSEPTK